MTYDQDACFLEPGHVSFLRGIPPSVEAEGMHGMDHVVNALVVALLTGGHVLLEGNPGLGKTALVRALSQALGLGRASVGRVQFTPDLMPADITGTLMPDEEGGRRLTFKPGPVFCNLLLADEINRATPKTQSAMLEAMAEYQVTVLGATHPLRKWETNRRDAYRTPFMVMATQNPIDQEGTHSLPEAQSDRFMFKISMVMPDSKVISKIVAKALRADKPSAGADAATLDDPVRVAEAMARLHEIGEAVLSVPLLPDIATHIVNMVQATNLQFDQVQGIQPTRMKRLRELVEGRVTYPLGPRAAMALARAVIGWAATALVTVDRAATEVPAHEMRALAEMIVPVLRHRLRIEHDYSDSATQQSAAAAVDDYIRALAEAAAPDGPERGNYPFDFAKAVARAKTTVKL